MPYDSFLVSKLIKEIERPVYLTGIYGGLKGYVLLSLMKKDLIFEFSNWPHFRLTEKMRMERDENPSLFVSMMRAKLKGAVLLSVEQIDFDRVVKFEFEVKNLIGESDIFDLYHEVMGNFSNLILVLNGKIVCALKDVFSSKRIISPNVNYILPPEDRIEPWKLKIDDFLDAHERLDLFLVKKVRGLSKKSAIEIAKLSNISFDTQIQTLRSDEIDRIVANIHTIVHEMDDSKTYVSLDHDGNPTDVYAFEPYGHFEIFNSASQAIESYLSVKSTTEILDSKKETLEKNVRRLIDKNEEILRKVSQEINDVKDADEFKKHGDLLMSNLHDLPKRAESVNVKDWESGQTISIALDPRMDVVKNAKKFFEMYGKMKKKFNGVKERQKIIEKRISYLQEFLYNVEHTTERNDLYDLENELALLKYVPQKKKKQQQKRQESSALSYEMEGFKILVGKNNIQNDRITRAASDDDLWFHVREAPGSHVIIITGGRTPSQNIIEFAASLAAGHSRLREDKWISVDYTYVKYLSKPRGAKPGFVLYKHFKTIKVMPRSN